MLSLRTPSSLNTRRPLPHQVVFRKVLQPLVNVVQSCQLSFPSGGQARAVLCYKLVDVMTTVGLRIGREMAREHMTATLQHFFVCFELVHGDGRPPAGLTLGNENIQPPSPPPPPHF